MTQSANNDRDLLEILVAVAWIDSEIQPEEKKFLENIAVAQNIGTTRELQDLLAKYENASTEECYRLLENYLGSNRNSTDYENLLSAVSKLIYSDSDITTEEATLLTKIQNLDPQSLKKRSTLDKAIDKIQKIYRAGLKNKS